MKSTEIKTEKELDERLAAIELKKISDVARQEKWATISSFMRLVLLGAVFLAGSLYPPFQEFVLTYITKLVENLANWYLAFAFVVILIGRRIVRYFWRV